MILGLLAHGLGRFLTRGKRLQATQKPQEAHGDDSENNSGPHNGPNGDRHG